MAEKPSAKWAERFVYGFGAGTADGDGTMRDLLGGKGANLAEMCKLALPVPPGFTITTATCNAYYAANRVYPAGLEAQVKAGLAVMEGHLGKRFGDPSAPLLVSVRSGARASMPGMMDTVLNLGMNDETAAGLAQGSGDARFAYDSYRRFIQMYSDVVLGVDHHHFEAILETYKEEQDLKADTDLSAQDWQAVVALFKAEVRKRLGNDFPTDPMTQLWGAIGAVFSSWMNKRAIEYRRLYDIPESWGTAVTVQAMVFGNMGETSATGVAFTRNPSTGTKAYYGEFLINAQGEDVVAGIRTPRSLTKAAREELKDKNPSMEEAMPEVYAELAGVFERLETHYRDMQDIEFTVEQGKLFMLQTRAGKRTARASIKIAVDMATEGLISQNEAVLRVDPSALDQLLHPTISDDFVRDILVQGLPASPGAAVGKVVFDADEAAEAAARGEPVILVRTETSPDDIHGMHAAKAIVTSRGGMTSHAAVVARGMGRPCVCGAGELRIDEGAGQFSVRGRIVRRGDVITVDGTGQKGWGQVLAGAAKMELPMMSGDFATLMQWADNARILKVRTNADTPDDVRVALDFGAEGIGLCRTEHMFFDSERIVAVREMILSQDRTQRVAALDKLLPFQRQDFVGIFRLLNGRPATIRLLDPPLHEFLPHKEEEFAVLADRLGMKHEDVRDRAKDLHEVNPMLGFRGCRLAIAYPEIYAMQTRAIFEAAIEVVRETGVAPRPEIMIPFVIGRRELAMVKATVMQAAQDALAAAGMELPYLIGTMIELPRAALRAEEIAQEASFFSFGTNDLTQTTLGVSRDDAAKFLGTYVDLNLLEKDPFVSLDQSGVGELVEMAVHRGRQGRPDLKLGICGEHGGDPSSIAFCQMLGLDYVSCSPYRVPVARLAAAHAALKQG